MNQTWRRRTLHHRSGKHEHHPVPAPDAVVVVLPPEPLPLLDASGSTPETKRVAWSMRRAPDGHASVTGRPSSIASVSVSVSVSVSLPVSVSSAFSSGTSTHRCRQLSGRVTQAFGSIRSLACSRAAVSVG